MLTELVSGKGPPGLQMATILLTVFSVVGEGAKQLSGVSSVRALILL